MIVLKTVIAITVLREVDAVAEGVASDPITDYELSGIAANIDDGPWLGSVSVTSEEVVPPELVEAECLALGNDGAFFINHK